MVASTLACSAMDVIESAKNDRRTLLSTPLRQRPTTGKLLELTPLWETVVRYNRLPQNVDKTHVFTELAVRLNEPEWEVRQHALRVLADLVPVVAKCCSAEDLDALMVPVVLTDVTHNLGHSAPAVRNSAQDVLMAYLKHTSDPEFVIRSVVSAGLESPAASGNLASTVIHILPRFLDQTVSISHQSLVHLVTAVSKKLAQMPHQRQAVETLNKIRDHVGENRFDHFLESYYPQVKRDLDVLCQVYQVETSVRDSGIDLQSPTPAQDEYWSESSISPSSQIKTEETKAEEYDGESDQDTEEEVQNKEVQFPKTEQPEGEAETGEEKKTPRRVRFGGEVVKLRTPDSDTIEQPDMSQESDSSQPNPSPSDEASFEVIRQDEKRPRSSHIPIPISPARSRPRRRQGDPHSIPSYDGGDSLTSSSEGENTRDFLQMQQDEEFTSLNFLPQDLLQLLLKKDDWRCRVRGLERLATWVHANRIDMEESRKLLVHLAGWLREEPRQARLVGALLRAIRYSLPSTPFSLVPALPWLVPTICRHLAGSSVLQPRLEAVEAIKSIMRITSPGPLIDVLFSESSITSRSSKIRENSLLCLMYALMTFPSNDFNCTLLTEKIISVAVAEPKRRVRQAILETLAVLSQFVPRTAMAVDPNDFDQPEDALFFQDGLQARLSRRQLPAVSTEGLVLYSLQIPPMTGADVDWVLAGSGSLSSGSARSRSQMDNAQIPYVSQSSDTMFNSSWSRDPNQNMMAVGVGIPQRSYENLRNNNYDERALYDQVWTSDPRHSHPSLTQAGSRPIYVSYQHGPEVRGTVPDEGFPQLSATYGGYTVRRGGQRELNQSWSGSRWVPQYEPPTHVSFKQSLPPIAAPHMNDWRTRREVQVDSGYRIQAQEELKRGRWSRRQENFTAKNKLANGSLIKENGISRSPKNSEASKSDTSLSRSLSDHGKSDLSFNKSIENGLTSSTPALRQLGTEPATVEPEHASEGDASLTSSFASIASQPHLEPKTQSLEDVNVNEKTVDEPDQSVEITPNSTDEPPLVTNINEMKNEGTGTGTGTPNSEIGSESSRDTELSTKSLESTRVLKRRIPRAIGPKGAYKANGLTRESVKSKSSLYPPSLPPFDKPKEAFAKTMLQLENPEWEVVMQGLQGLVRLARHHGKDILPMTHAIIAPLTKQVRNLRSQVSRGACQSAEELFQSLGRALDPEVEDIAGALLSRMADTNKFLRSDSTSALDAMVDHTSPNKSVAALVSKGAKHQNAVVRGATCRLLLKLCTRLGPERTMSLPKETRDAILVTSAKFLTEGSLETRGYAKEIFTMLSSDPKLHSILSDVVPNNIMRSIHKVLARITSKQ